MPSVLLRGDNPRPGQYSRMSFSSDQVTGKVFSCLSFQILNLFRTLSSWGSSNYRPSAPFLYEVASHVKKTAIPAIIIIIIIIITLHNVNASCSDITVRLGRLILPVEIGKVCALFQMKANETCHTTTCYISLQPFCLVESFHFRP